MNTPQAKRSTKPVGKIVGNYILYWLARATLTVLRLLPVKVVCAVARVIGLMAYRMFRKRRKIVATNLRIATRFLGDEPENLDQLVREVFCRSSINILVGLQFSAISSAKVEKFVHLEGIEVFAKAARKGRGVIIVMAHMGPWEALAHFPDLFRSKGLMMPFAALYRPLNNRPLNKWIKEQREISGTKMFSREDGFNSPLAHLRAGGALGVLADQKMKQGPKVGFFGQPAYSNPIPGIFQKRTKAELIGMSFAKVGKLRWRLTFHQPENMALEEYHSREDMALACNQLLEKTMSESLTDVFWFQRRFLSE
ncbi:MAG: hypothetical protein LAT55_03945 [Opitutales bacterium]|nr:hypothetical protein [Opitutales bacterium]